MQAKKPMKTKPSALERLFIRYPRIKDHIKAIEIEILEKHTSKTKKEVLSDLCEKYGFISMNAFRTLLTLFGITWNNRERKQRPFDSNTITFCWVPEAKRRRLGTISLYDTSSSKSSSATASPLNLESPNFELELDSSLPFIQGFNQLSIYFIINQANIDEKLLNEEELKDRFTQSNFHKLD